VWFNPAEDSGAIQVLSQESDILLRRIRRQGTDGDLSSSITVLVISERTTPNSLNGVAREYEFAEYLDPDWALRPLELVQEHGQTILILEDPGGELLSQLLDTPMEVEKFLRVAIGITAAVSKMHQRGLIHKDIKPANILVNGRNGAIRLTGFGIASRVPRERQPPDLPQFIAGTLAYMAPEQTGRMNRSIDSRSDLYALGITFYRMLTGRRGFRSRPRSCAEKPLSAAAPVPQHAPSVSSAVSSPMSSRLASSRRIQPMVSANQRITFASAGCRRQSTEHLGKCCERPPRRRSTRQR
jgi:serine/threonine protein kinase